MTYDINWDAVQHEWESGCFSNVTLGSRHGCAESTIRKRAKQGQWVKVPKQLKNQLVHERLLAPT